MGREGFSNPVSNALGQLIRLLLQSDNYVPGVSGWAIYKNGNAEFASGTFRGTITVTSPNGQKIVIDASTTNPTITFYSIDGTNTSFLNAPNPGGPSNVGVQISSGRFTPADALERRIRVGLDDTFGIGQFTVIKTSNDLPKGGEIQLKYDSAFFGYTDTDAFIHQLLTMTATGAVWTVDEIAVGGANVTYDTPTPGGLQTFEQGRGSIATMVYTGGTGVTTANNVTEVPLPAWTNADAIRFINNRIYRAHVRCGVFSSVTAITEMSRIRLRSAVNSIAAQQLGVHVLPVIGGATVTTFDFSVPIKNVSGADIDKTSLGLTIQRGPLATGLHSIYGDAPTANFAAHVEIEDLGFAADSRLRDAAVAIT